MFPFFLIVLNVVEFDVKIASRIKFFQTKWNEKPHISIVIESDEKLVWFNRKPTHKSLLKPFGNEHPRPLPPKWVRDEQFSI